LFTVLLKVVTRKEKKQQFFVERVKLTYPHFTYNVMYHQSSLFLAFFPL